MFFALLENVPIFARNCDYFYQKGEQLHSARLRFTLYTSIWWNKQSMIETKPLVHDLTPNWHFAHDSCIFTRRLFPLLGRNAFSFFFQFAASYSCALKCIHSIQFLLCCVSHSLHYISRVGRHRIRCSIWDRIHFKMVNIIINVSSQSVVCVYVFIVISKMKLTLCALLNQMKITKKENTQNRKE